MSDLANTQPSAPVRAATRVAGPSRGGATVHLIHRIKITAIGLVNLTFKTDHHLMNDNNSDWTTAGSPIPKPEWTIGRNSLPISHSKDKVIEVELEFAVEPADADETIADVIGRADLKADPGLATPVQRAAHTDVIDEAISAWTRRYTKREAMERLGSAGVPAGATFDTLELTEDEHLNRREAIVTVEHPTRGRLKMPGWPVHMEHSHVRVEAAPLLGQHNRDVYTELLELRDDELARLHEQGVI